MRPVPRSGQGPAVQATPAGGAGRRRSYHNTGGRPRRIRSRALRVKHPAARLEQAENVAPGGRQGAVDHDQVREIGRIRQPVGSPGRHHVNQHLRAICPGSRQRRAGLRSLDRVRLDRMNQQPRPLGQLVCQTRGIPAQHQPVTPGQLRIRGQRVSERGDPGRVGIRRKRLARRAGRRSGGGSLAEAEQAPLVRADDQPAVGHGQAPGAPFQRAAPHRLPRGSVQSHHVAVAADDDMPPRHDHGLESHPLVDPLHGFLRHRSPPLGLVEHHPVDGRHGVRLFIRVFPVGGRRLARQAEIAVRGGHQQAGVPEDSRVSTIGGVAMQDILRSHIQQLIDEDAIAATDHALGTDDVIVLRHRPAQRAVGAGVGERRRAAVRHIHLFRRGEQVTHGRERHIGFPRDLRRFPEQATVLRVQREHRRPPGGKQARAAIHHAAVRHHARPHRPERHQAAGAEEAGFPRERPDAPGQAPVLRLEGIQPAVVGADEHAAVRHARGQADRPFGEERPARSAGGGVEGAHSVVHGRAEIDSIPGQRHVERVVKIQLGQFRPPRLGDTPGRHRLGRRRIAPEGRQRERQGFGRHAAAGRVVHVGRPVFGHGDSGPYQKSQPRPGSYCSASHLALVSGFSIPLIVSQNNLRDNAGHFSPLRLRHCLKPALVR